MKKKLIFGIGISLVIFVASRLTMLVFTPAPKMSDTSFYAEYAGQYELARQQKSNFYDLHEQLITNFNNVTRSKSDNLPMLRTSIEYPPLAIQWLRLPLISIDPVLVSDKSLERFYHKLYQKTYRWLCAGVDLLLFVFLLFLILKMYPKSSCVEKIERVSLYIVSGFVLQYVLYDRIDIVMSLLVLLSFALLCSSAHYLWSFALLALAINFKVVPILLVPFWIIGSLPLSFFNKTSLKKTLEQCALTTIKRVLLMGSLVMIFFVPFFAMFGIKSTEFLSYHQNRGIEIESIWSSVTFFLSQFAHNTTKVFLDYGSFNIESSHTQMLISLSHILLPTGVLFVVIFFCWYVGKSYIRRTSCADRQKNPTISTFANIHPGSFCSFIFLMLFTATCMSNVLSPQYLIWFLPLIVLLPKTNLFFRITPWLFILTCILTAYIFPSHFLMGLCGGIADASGLLHFGEPTASAAALPLFRNAGLLMVLGFTVTAIYKTSRTAGFISSPIKK